MDFLKITFVWNTFYEMTMRCYKYPNLFSSTQTVNSLICNAVKLQELFKNQVKGKKKIKVSAGRATEDFWFWSKITTEVSYSGVSVTAGAIKYTFYCAFRAIRWLFWFILWAYMDMFVKFCLLAGENKTGYFHLQSSSALFSSSSVIF